MDIYDSNPYVFISISHYEYEDVHPGFKISLVVSVLHIIILDTNSLASVPAWTCKEYDNSAATWIAPAFTGQRALEGLRL